MNNTIDWTRIKNNINGNPRYVCHFFSLLTESEKENIPGDIHTQLKRQYLIALNRAHLLGGRKFHNKQYGGGIAFQSYNINALTKKINTLIKEESTK